MTSQTDDEYFSELLKEHLVGVPRDLHTSYQKIVALAREVHAPLRRETAFIAMKLLAGAVDMGKSVSEDPARSPQGAVEVAITLASIDR